MPKSYDVIVVGDYCLDLIFTGLPRFPGLGYEVIGTGFAMTPGGAYITAAAMHRLGLKVGWAADFGDDDFSRFVLEHAAKEGLDDSLFVRHRRSLRFITVAASYPEDRAFIAYYDPAPAVPAGMKALAKASARVLYVSGLYTGPLLDAGLKVLQVKGTRLVMDGNAAEGDQTLEEASVRRVLRNLDIFMPSALEAKKITQVESVEGALRALSQSCSLVVIKNGAGGAYACCGEEIVHAPAIEVTPLDTTGAGDCFNAGFIKAWLDDRPLEECLRWGNVVGGLSTLGMGGTGRVVTAEEVDGWLGQ